MSVSKATSGAGKLKGLLGWCCRLAILACHASFFTFCAGAIARAGADPFPSTYKPANGSFAIVGASILTADGPEIPGGTIVVTNGRISAIGPAIAVPAGVPVIDGHDKWVTPGIIDPHSHLGADSMPVAPAGSSYTNEMSSPNTAEVWVEHSIRADDPNFARARESGVTTLQILPGSTNVFGGRTVILKNVRSATVEGMKMPNAPYGAKMACGENPTRLYGGPAGAARKAPGTPMESMAIMRDALDRATHYAQEWQQYRRQRAAHKPGQEPRRDLQMETVAGILKGEIRLNIHCYRADQMVQLINLSHEFHFRITSFHHAVEAYRITALLREEHIGIASWADFPTGIGQKLEAYNAIPENGAFVSHAGVLFAVHSDLPLAIQHLNSQSGRLMARSTRMGWPVSRADAIRWLTLNPAILLGIDNQTGSLAVGKGGDLVLWNKDPFSIYSLPEKVFIDGGKVFDRDEPPASDSDLMLGLARRH